MIKFIRTLKIDIFHMVISKRFWSSCVLVVVISLFSLANEIQMTQGSSSVYYLYNVYYFYPYWMLLLMIGTIPGAMTFCVDWNNYNYRNSIIRAGKKIYAFSKVFACFLSTILFVFVSEWLLLLCLRFFCEIITVEEQFSTNMSGYLLTDGKVWVYFLTHILTHAFFAGFFSVFALWVSTKYINVFVVLATPIILFYFIENVTIWLQLPLFFSINRIGKGNVLLLDDPWLTLLYAMAVFLVLSLILSIAFYFGCKRRVEHA